MDDLVLTPDELEEFDDWLDWQQSLYEGALATLIDQQEPEKENLAEASTFDEIPF